MKKRDREQNPVADFRDEYPKFTKGMKHTHKILIPDMLPVHFGIIVEILKKDGWDLELLHNDSRAVIDEGLKHVHNDTCYPALCVTGQFIDALKSGKYDPEHTAVMITSGFPVDLKTLAKLAFAIFYGDTLMSLYNQCKPYETEKGASDKAREECVGYILDMFSRKKYLRYKKITKHLLERFQKVRRSGETKVKVGIVGEIYVKYSPLGNNHLEEFLLSENCEPVVPALMDFVMYCAVNNVNDAKLYNKKSAATPVFNIVYKYLHHVQKKIIRLTEKYRFEPLHDFEHLRKCADKVINQGVKMGEGWLIPAEMAALAETGTDNIVCAQPFGCLPNHIAGKGTIRTLKEMYKYENIVAVDYDPSATKVNQENRIKLMLATARENLNQQEKKE